MSLRARQSPELCSSDLRVSALLSPCSLLGQYTLFGGILHLNLWALNPKPLRTTYTLYFMDFSLKHQGEEMHDLYLVTTIQPAMLLALTQYNQTPHPSYNTYFLRCNLYN